MITIVLGWWALLTSVTVSAETEARGATLDFARVESQYRCGKVLADLCAARELGPPVRVDTGAAQCEVGGDGIHVCCAACAGECSVAQD